MEKIILDAATIAKFGGFKEPYLVYDVEGHLLGSTNTRGLICTENGDMMILGPQIPELDLLLPSSSSLSEEEYSEAVKQPREGRTLEEILADLRSQ